MPKPEQVAAFLSPADELFFGGKAGAGKSDVLLGLGLTKHRKTLFLRRQATQLQEISARVQEVMRPGDRWRGSGHGGVLTTSDGRVVEFAGCDNEKDKQKYKGRAHDLKAWDEVVDFPESVYLFVNGWNRTVVPGQRCRVVAASNPPTTAEGEWVIKRWRPWLDPGSRERAAPGELRWYTTIAGEEVACPDGSPLIHGGETYTPRSRTFIPGDMLDLLKATGYQNTLATLPEPLRSIYLKGDFTASGQDALWQLIPRAWVQKGQQRYVERAKALPTLSALGCDVAMGGQDQTCFAPRHANTIAPLVCKPGKQTPDGPSVVALLVLCGGGGEVPTNLDVIGIGKSAYDTAATMNLKNVRPVVVSNSTTWRDPKVPTMKFANLRAAMMWKVRAWLDPDGGPEETRLALPPDPELAADLTAPLYKMQVNGVAVESKDDIRVRIGRSTDRGDAVALACWEPGGWVVGR